MNGLNRKEIETEVLIIGGGTAGCLAAMAAAQKGNRVSIVEKGGSIRHSGCLATGVDHYLLSAKLLPLGRGLLT